uniref:GrpE protein homolog n=1 Tax=Polytomella sp. Pringsheim 198.80 TaxID=37502 RepID=A0A024FSJ0_9CHLO|nr:GrpE protein homolog, mitochondrial [Polytomella sp. Pringsheim 198.80]|mmetsp:Transcript_11978/g.21483  ORF Transcript_11978/g.21483 Transcript_11978/m.21483 type:complete len:272 (-) Transcript_11978:600-1415(-)|eukprot:CAMPEP_0175078576 /NCGR_PEP_ID=MMETSP0052_2-20121109/24216_1 /TAXON_ID=51329 ORGANISM="Polytomella parva, Strain SAG 63-3" /NCGR_SAMPLE_ID=MMETSP0052_2 /ASSEMBLY_ACC=CAM_ASM_000194 /LENGTH=271 /DNA_ID=CAMNT_0016348555 /DNA_START=21 /DNA_END=836 /DNA_ORIENTATION=+
MSVRIGSRVASVLARSVRSASANKASSFIQKNLVAVAASRSLIPVTAKSDAAPSFSTFASQQCFFSSTQNTATEANGNSDEATTAKDGTPEETKSVDDLLAQIQKLEENAAATTKQNEQLTDALKRSLAEMENLRVRTTREVENAKKFALQNFVKALFDVSDNLERAAGVVPKDAVADDSTADAAKLRKMLKGLHEGVLATETIMMSVLKKQGVVRFDPTGEAFDPNFHNALFDMPDPTKENGTIAIVTKKGYTLNERVVRPAEVGVVRNS